MKADLTNVNHYPVEKLLITLRKYDELIFPVDRDFLEDFPIYKKSCLIFLEKSGIDCKEQDKYSIYIYADILLERLVRDKLIKEWKQYDSIEKEGNDGSTCIFSITHKAYTLTSEGLDIVLKVEAHNDAERRHQDTNSHNVLMRQIAIISFLISLAAVGVSGYLANLANKNIELNQKRLELYQHQIESLESRVSDKQMIFTGEIKRLVYEAIEQNQQQQATPPLIVESEADLVIDPTEPVKQDKPAN
ncbi:hypothetical protein [Pseudoalteromonas prydzensis]|uniref:hypothetical protein n=1 Tax=Pseudoalteromonas prydzensis TaxID=182141 RepID=UPI0024BCF4E0|nr:hypothetical protein [Pseudoalteromonas prydzensis]